MSQISDFTFEIGVLSARRGVRYNTKIATSMKNAPLESSSESQIEPPRVCVRVWWNSSRSAQPIAVSKEYHAHLSRQRIRSSDRKARNRNAPSTAYSMKCADLRTE